MNAVTNPSPELAANLIKALMNAGMSNGELELFAGNPEIIETVVRIVQESNSLEVDYDTRLPFTVIVNPPHRGVVSIPVSSISLKSFGELTDAYKRGTEARVREIQNLLKTKEMVGADAWFGHAILRQPAKLPIQWQKLAQRHHILLPGTQVKINRVSWTTAMTYSTSRGWQILTLRGDVRLSQKTLVMVLEDPRTAARQ